MLTAKEAVRVATAYMKDMYGDIEGLLLEEIELDGNLWVVTMGFWLALPRAQGLAVLEARRVRRVYKEIRLGTDNGQVVSMKIRELPEANRMRWDYRQSILVDTKLLVVLVVGWVAPEKVGKIGRTDGYTADDFDQLNDIVSQYRHAVTTPHVLTEATNFVFQGAHGELVDELAAMMQRLYVLTDERHVTARKIGRDTLARPLGLADAGIIEAAQCGVAVLTADLKLYNELIRRNLRATNFNQIRFTELFDR